MLALFFLSLDTDRVGLKVMPEHMCDQGLRTRERTQEQPCRRPSQTTSLGHSGAIAHGLVVTCVSWAVLNSTSLLPCRDVKKMKEMPPEKSLRKD